MGSQHQMGRTVKGVRGGAARVVFQFEILPKQRPQAVIVPLRPNTKIMPLDGRKSDTVLLAAGKWYDFYEFGCYTRLTPEPETPGMR